MMGISRSTRLIKEFDQKLAIARTDSLKIELYKKLQGDVSRVYDSFAKKFDANRDLTLAL